VTEIKYLALTRVRFGPFELDLRSGELCRGERRIALQEQPFRVLQSILKNGSELTTREQIRKALWPHDTVVEFDHGINTAIKKIRQALGDSAEDPKYIQTVARRGYRCMVPVEWPADLSAAGVPSGRLANGLPNPLVNGPGEGLRDPKDAADGRAATPENSVGAGGLTGKRVSHYRVLEILGGGGMGVVYKALDLKLDRPVALKFLPEEMGENEKAVARFEREARAVSALDHPNICPIYEFGEQEGRPFIVMPLLEGRNLRDILAECDGDPASAFPIEKVLELSVQIASGLEAAHDKGIIHRDIKPANIFITQRGVAKILDFGIAKMLPATESGESEVEEEGLSGEHVASTTETGHTSLTRTGIAVGSAGYMSPEQVRGEKLDARTDLFSFGLVLYEMATGQRAFTGETAAIVHSAILNENPMSPRALNRRLPVELQAIIDQALQKDRKLRYGSAGVMLTDLKTTRQERTAGGSPQTRRRILRWGGVAAVAVLFITAAIWYFTPTRLPRVTGSTQLTDGITLCCPMATDSLRLYFREDRPEAPLLSQMSVAGGDVLPLPPLIAHPVMTDISPDRSSLLVSTYDAEMAPFWNLPLPNGSPRRIGDILGSWPSWAPDGKHLVYARNFDVYIAAADGSDARRVVSETQGKPTELRFSPDGSRIRFTLANLQTRSNSLWEVRPDGSKLHELLPGWSLPANRCCGKWTPDGRYYVFESDVGKDAHDIFALADSQGLLSKPQHTPTRLTFGPLRFESPLVSSDGKKLFAYGWHQRGELVRYDSASGQFIPFLGSISATDVAFSRDGKWIAYVAIPGYTLWRSRVDGSERLQLTSSSGNTAALPRWSPDGKRIAFTSVVNGKPWRLFLIGIDGGSPTPLLPEGNPETDPTWSGDGSQIAFATGVTAASEKSEIEVVNVNTLKVSTISGSGNKFSPRWTPDGRYLAALSFEYPAKTVFLYDFNTNQWTKWFTDRNVGYISWTADSRSLQYVETDGDGGAPIVRRVRIGSSHPQDLFGLKGFRRFPGLNGYWTGITPDDAQMFVRDMSGRDIYALDVDFP
jgi:eukaryotic-like serine/threonine-protein kinase